MKALIDDAEAAGWSTQDITTALTALADNHMLADEANKQTDLEIQKALRRLWL